MKIDVYTTLKMKEVKSWTHNRALLFRASWLMKLPLKWIKQHNKGWFTRGRRWRIAETSTRNQRQLGCYRFLESPITRDPPPSHHPLFRFSSIFAFRLILDTILYHVNMKYYTQLNSEERQHSNGSLFVLANIFEGPFNNSYKRRHFSNTVWGYGRSE